MNNFSLESLRSIPLVTNQRVLAHDEARLVLYLLDLLDAYAGENTSIIEDIKKSEEKVDVNAVRKKLRDAWCNDTTMIDALIASDKHALEQHHKDILVGFKKHVKGKFICLKYFADYAVFSPMEQGGIYFGVVALSEDFEEMIQIKPPYILETVLLHYKDIIIWDGLVATYNIPISRVVAKNIVEEAKQARRHGLVTTTLE